jgi:hypothetical protein
MRKKPIPDPGSKGQKGNGGPRIRIRITAMMGSIYTRPILACVAGTPLRLSSYVCHLCGGYLTAILIASICRENYFAYLIFRFFSMGGNNHRCTESLLKYIKAEHQNKKGVSWCSQSIKGTGSQDRIQILYVDKN